MSAIISTEISEIITDATSSGYDVEIVITQRTDGKKGTVKLPMAWVNRLADRKIAEKKAASDSATP